MRKNGRNTKPTHGLHYKTLLEYESEHHQNGIAVRIFIDRFSGNEFSDFFVIFNRKNISNNTRTDQCQTYDRIPQCAGKW